MTAVTYGQGKPWLGPLATKDRDRWDEIFGPRKPLDQKVAPSPVEDDKER